MYRGVLEDAKSLFAHWCSFQPPMCFFISFKTYRFNNLTYLKPTNILFLYVILLHMLIDLGGTFFIFFKF